MKATPNETCSSDVVVRRYGRDLVVRLPPPMRSRIYAARQVGRLVRFHGSDARPARLSRQNCGHRYDADHVPALRARLPIFSNRFSRSMAIASPFLQWSAFRRLDGSPNTVKALYCRSQSYLSHRFRHGTDAIFLRFEAKCYFPYVYLIDPDGYIRGDWSYGLTTRDIFEGKALFTEIDRLVGTPSKK